MKKIIAFILCIILIVGTLPISAMAASATASTMRLEKYQGSVTVKNASGKTLGTSGKMRLYSGYQVTTARGSYAYISLDGSKSIKLDASSKVTIAQQGRKLEVLVNYGKLLFDVNQPLNKDETLNIRTSTMVTGVRGTIGWMEVNEKDESQLKLIEGKTTVMLVNPLSGETQMTEISSGQTLSSIMQDEPGDDSITIVIDELKEEDIPGFVGTMIAENPDMQQRIENNSTLNVSSIVDNAEEQLKQDEAEAAAAAKEADNDIQQDIKEVESAKQSVSLFEKQEVESVTPPAPIIPAPDPEPEPEPVLYTIIFNTGKLELNIASQRVESGSHATDPMVESIEGYNFDGWYKDANYTQLWNFGIDIVTQDTIIYAKWTEIPTSMTLNNPNPEEFAEALAAISESAYTKELILEDADLQYGAFTLAEGTTLTVNSGTFVVTQAITINGTFNLSAGATLINQGSIQISSNASFNVADGASFVNEGVFIDYGAKFGAKIELNYTGESGGQINELVFMGNPAYANLNAFSKNMNVNFFGADAYTMTLPNALTIDDSASTTKEVKFTISRGKVTLNTGKSGLTIGNKVALILSGTETNSFLVNGNISLADAQNEADRPYFSAVYSTINASEGDAITVGVGTPAVALNNTTVKAINGAAIINKGVLQLNSSCKAYGYTYGVYVYSTGTLTSSSDSKFWLTKPAKELVDNETNFAIYIVETEVNENYILGTAYALTNGNLYNVETDVTPSGPNESDGYYYSLVLAGSGT